MTRRTYATPLAFKQALEQRLRATRSGATFARQRQLLVFDRFLARLGSIFGDAMTVKGGLALELRIERARTTRDIDLRLVGSSECLLARLQEAARLDAGDFLSFEVVPDPQHPEIQNAGMQYEGLRFRGTCQLAGKPFGQPFGIDVAFGDPMNGSPDEVVGEDVLAFAGIAPPRVRIYPLETHIAEKLHAYTLPRARPNTRVKDLPDLALLAGVRSIVAARLREALLETFAFRDTHALPKALPEPPASWAIPYAALAREDELVWATLDEVTAAAKRFLDPVLSGAGAREWDPVGAHWR
jgi:hypothetical protein